MSNIVSLEKYRNNKEKPLLTANTVNSLITSMINDYTKILVAYDIDMENPDIAFDIATIQFLMRGMAHRTQGENHPSQTILNAMRHNMLGT